jgi:HK97 family phage major capsid protein
LQHAIIEKYRRNAVFFLNDATALTVRKLKNAVDGNYLWQPALIAGQPDTLLGKAVYTDPNMPEFTGISGLTGVLFGDFSKYILRQVRTVTVSRSDEYGWDSDMVAFKGTWRGDGGLSDLQAIAGLSETVAAD